MQTKRLQKRDQRWKKSSILLNAKQGSALRVSFATRHIAPITMGIMLAVQKRSLSAPQMRIAPLIRFVPPLSPKLINFRQS